MPAIERTVFGPYQILGIDKKTNSAATVTLNAVTGLQYFIDFVKYSASDAPAAAVEALIKVNSATVDQVEIPAAASPAIIIPLKLLVPISQNFIWTVPALGAGVVCAISVHGKLV